MVKKRKGKSKALGRERTLTDRSLKAERSATDLSMARRGSEVQGVADAARRKLRKETDAEIRRDRKDADGARNRQYPSGAPSPEVAAERRRAMKALDRERRLADRGAARQRRRSDSLLAQERQVRRETEKVLFRRERERTDRDLGHERGRMDVRFRAAERRLALAKTARERSAAAVEVRDEFLAILSHDLRSPLNVIAINAARVGRMVPGGEGAAQIKLRPLTKTGSSRCC